MAVKRTIKFRIWNKTSKEMYQPHAFIEDYESRDDIELMQFTGLSDRLGKEIYEGDIIQVPHKLMKKYKWEVIFHKGAFVLSDKIGFRHFYSQKYSQNYEVIGNIYESKHLFGNSIVGK